MFSQKLLNDSPALYYERCKRLFYPNNFVNILRKLPKGKTILDFGAGEGHLKRVVEEMGHHYIAIEPNVYARTLLEEAHTTVYQSISEFQALGISVDVIICSNVLSEILNTALTDGSSSKEDLPRIFESLISNLMGVLEPTGFILIEDIYFGDNQDIMTVDYRNSSKSPINGANAEVNRIMFDEVFFDGKEPYVCGIEYDSLFDFLEKHDIVLTEFNTDISPLVLAELKKVFNLSGVSEMDLVQTAFIVLRKGGSHGK